MTASAAPELVPPLVEWVPEYDYTLGPEVGEVAALANFPPDPEQQLILDATFAVRDGKAAARDVGIECPRQNLKTGSLKQMSLGWLYVLELPLITWTAHEFATSQEAFRDMCELIESTPDLDREVFKIHRGNGDEAIELLGNRRLRFRARTQSGGRGMTGNRIVLDESMYVRASHLGSLVPTLRAVPDPQIVFAGSAGFADSVEWRRLRDRGRAGGDPSLAYYGWAGDLEPGGCEQEDCTHLYGTQGCALDDEERWARSNPALGRRITLETLRNDRRLMPADRFAVETVGWWEPPADESDPDGLTTEDWAAIGPDPEGDQPLPAPTDPVTIGVDAAPNLTSASVVAAGGGVLELLERRPGTSWFVDYVVEVYETAVERQGSCQVGYDAAGPVAALVPELERRKVAMVPVEGKDATRAVAAFVRGAKDGDFAHRGEPELVAAVAGAKRREVGDGHKWSRKDSSVDISPLVAATVALWLGQFREEPYDPSKFIY